MKTQMGVLIWENPVSYILGKGSQLVLVPPLVEQSLYIIPCFGQKTMTQFASYRILEVYWWIELPESERFSFVFRYNRSVGIIFEISSMILQHSAASHKGRMQPFLAARQISNLYCIYNSKQLKTSREPKPRRRNMPLRIPLLSNNKF